MLHGRPEPVAQYNYVLLSTRFYAVS